MEDKSYFLSAVLIAVVVPILIGVVYFKRVYDSKMANEYVYLLDEQTELLFLGNDTLEEFKLDNLSLSDYQNGNYTDFSIKYTTGMENYISYNLSLENINLSPNIDAYDISWKLVLLGGQEVEVSNGKFSDTGKINLITDSIFLNEIKNYRLYYFVSSKNEYKRGSVRALIKLS